MLMTILQHPIAHGALIGALGSAHGDFLAFKGWQSAHDALTYSWGIAIFRWVQGAIIGAVPTAGIGAL